MPRATVTIAFAHDARFGKLRDEIAHKYQGVAGDQAITGRFLP
jgi:hypothetical protein